ncbi:MAG: RNA polymerase sigma factor [Thermoguttaceae bacterium]
MNPLSLYDAIFRYVARLLSDSETAKDIVQEVFLRLEQHRKEVAQERPWVYRTARNLVLDHFRHLQRARKVAVDIDDMPAEATLFDPKRLIENKEISQMIHKKINELSAKQREVLRLKFQEGLKYHEIAEVLGLSTSHVGVILHESIAFLRKEMAK